MSNCLQPYQVRRWPPLSYEVKHEVKPASVLEQATNLHGVLTTGLRNQWYAVCAASFVEAGATRQVACAAAGLAEAR